MQVRCYSLAIYMYLLYSIYVSVSIWFFRHFRFIIKIKSIYLHGNWMISVMYVICIFPSEAFMLALINLFLIMFMFKKQLWHSFFKDHKWNSSIFKLNGDHNFQVRFSRYLVYNLNFNLLYPHTSFLRLRFCGYADKN